MARKVLSSQSVTFEFDAKKNPTLKGIYTGKREVETKYGDTVIYDIEDDDGNSWSVWNCATLEKPMTQVNEGETVEITFKGIGKPKRKGQNGAKLFEVAVFDDHAPRGKEKSRGKGKR